MKTVIIALSMLGGSILSAQTLLDSITFHNSTYDIDFSDDGSMIFVAGKDSTGTIWDASGNLISKYEGHSSSVSSINYFSKTKTVLTGAYDHDNTAVLWDLKGKEIARLTGHSNAVINIDQTDDLLATASRDQTAKVWKRDGTLLFSLEEHTGQVNFIHFFEDRQWILTGSYDKTLKIWDYEGNLLHTYNARDSGIRSIIISNENNRIVLGHRDGSISIMDLEGKLLKVIKAHQEMIWGLQFIKGTSLFISGSADKAIKLWDLEGRLLNSFLSNRKYVSGIAYAKQKLVVAGGDGIVRVWNLTPEYKFTCQNTNYAFLKKTIGIWEVKTKDRTSPGHYEKNSGMANITDAIQGCGISISYRGTFKDKPYAREVIITGKDSNKVQMVAMDSEHGSFSTLEGKIIDDKMGTSLV